MPEPTTPQLSESDVNEYEQRRDPDGQTLAKVFAWLTVGQKSDGESK